MLEENTGARHRRAFRRQANTELPLGGISSKADEAATTTSSTSAAPTTTAPPTTSETPTTTSSSTPETTSTPTSTSTSTSTSTTAETTSSTTSTSSTEASTTSDLISGLLSGVLGGGSTTTTSSSSTSTSKTSSSKTSATAQVTPPATDLTTSVRGTSTFVQTIEASASASATDSSDASTDDSSNSNTGTIIGAVAGGLVGVAILATVISFLIRRYNRRRIERDASQFDEDAFRKSAVMLDEDNNQNSLFTPRPPPTPAPAMSDRGYGASLYANQNQAPGRSVSPIPSYNQSYSDHQYPQSPPSAQHDAYYGGGQAQAMHPYDPMSPQGYYGEPAPAAYYGEQATSYDVVSPTSYEQHYQAYEQQASYPRMASVSEHATNVEEVPTRKSVTPFQADQYIDDEPAPAQEATRVTSPTVPAGLPAALMPGGRR